MTSRDQEFTRERGEYLRGLVATTQEIRERLEDEPMGRRRDLLDRLVTLLDEVTEVSRELLLMDQG